MARPGRNRGVGRREPNGQIQRESVEEIKSVVMAQRRRFLGPGVADLAADPRIGFALGRLRLLGEAEARAGDEICRGITEAQFQAGVRFAHLEARWRCAEGMPRSAAGISGYGLRVSGAAAELDQSEVAAIQRAFAEAVSAIGSDRDIAAICDLLGDERPADMRAAKRALSALADHFKGG